MWALFLDFDGTLVELAATPDAVVVPRTLRTILSACADAIDGAVAIVSGRPIEGISNYATRQSLFTAGEQGPSKRLPTLCFRGRCRGSIDKLPNPPLTPCELAKRVEPSWVVGLRA